jgi:hypothetical protein
MNRKEVIWNFIHRVPRMFPVLHLHDAFPAVVFGKQKVSFDVNVVMPHGSVVVDCASIGVNTVIAAAANTQKVAFVHNEDLKILYFTTALNIKKKLYVYKSAE